MIYGTKVDRSIYHPLADVIGQVETSQAGNVVLRVGQEVAPHNGWHQTAHVVLTPDEARALAALLILATGGRS